MAIAVLAAAAPAAAEVEVTSSEDSGTGSLRQVVADAPAGETIVIKPGVDPQLASEIEIGKSLTIRGQGAAATTIGAASLQTRLFEIGEGNADISVTLEALTLSGGNAPDGAPGNSESLGVPPGNGQPGGGGGAILNKADDLRLVHVAFTDNSAGDGGEGGSGLSQDGGHGGAGGSGGAIWNSGGVAIVGATFTGNEAGAGALAGISFSALSGNPGVGGGGGAIYNSGELTITESLFVENRAGDGAEGADESVSGDIALPGAGGGGGGAIHSVGSLALSGSTLTGNVAGTGGTGGFSSIPTTPSAPVRGGAGGSGGAVLADGPAAVTNSTFTENAAGAGGTGGSTSDGAFPGSGGSGGSGGAIEATQETTVAAATVTANAAGLGGVGGLSKSGDAGEVGLNGASGGVSGRMSVRGSILAANSGGNCESRVTDGGGNLAFPAADGCDSIDVGDPQLDPAGLASNGGPTETIALLPGSAALDAVPAGGCLAADGSPLATDQRGVARPQGAACDAGAYEREVQKPPPPTPPLPPTPTPTPSPSSSQDPDPPLQRTAPEAPDTQLTKTPKKVLKTRQKRSRVVLRFASTPAGAAFECKLDKASFTPCESPKAYRLEPGRHTIQVRAVLGGLADPTPAKTRVKIVRIAR